MLSTSQSLLSFFSLLCSFAQAKPHANAHRHQHSSGAVAVRAPSSDTPNIGIVYDGTSQLGAFSGRIGFSVDWSPLPLSSSDGLDLGTFIPQLWTFQDSNRELQYQPSFPIVSGSANWSIPRTDLNPWTDAAPSWPTGISLIGFNEPDQ